LSRYVREKPLTALWIAVGVVIVGRLVDLQWHLPHDNFGGAADQVQAHLVVWIGVLMLLGVSAIAVRQGAAGLGYRLSLGGAAFYVPVAIWHFVEHANRSDFELPHILIALAYIATLIGVVAVTVPAIRQRPTAPS
jgi:hypothetical protein